MNFFTGGSVIMDYRCLNDLIICSYTSSVWLHKTLTDGLEWRGLLVDYCDVLSAVWTLILMAPIHCRGSTDEQVM